ncbi:hypothetical protein L6452_41256 [Arctium lappa]|uniref:Uncharacterized protein n=1 Tax=Arctium lappa TaxID=4217 RepID=A0ACB8XPS6_ARCLA|nr:hypothetical protein L6452_41256 [Arctium lappa]
MINSELGSRVDYINTCVPLYNASVKGDWEVAEAILDKQPELVRFGISENYDTALHISAFVKTSKLLEKFVKNLVNRMTNEDLELQNKYHNTALCVAAAAGNVKIAMTMVNKHRALLEIPGNQQMMPLYMACLFGRNEMVNYLYANSNKMAGDFWTYQNRDVALKMVTDREELARNGYVLGVLARKTDAFFAIIHVKVGPAIDKQSDAMNLVRIIWTKIVTLPKVEIDVIIRVPGEMQDGVRKYASRILFVAAKMGNTKFVVELIRQYPDLLWKTNDKNQSIFHVAVKYRHEGIYNLLYEIGSMKDMIIPLKDMQGNNMLHLVGKCPKRRRLENVSGVALQTQRELLWFKEVEAMLPPSYREMKNNARITPRNLFSKEHNQLLCEGEKWMKETASQSMVVSALIATIVFAAAFTVPGGYNQENG